MIYRIVFIFIFLGSIMGIAQEDKKLKTADEKYENLNYVDARAIYLEVAKSGYTSDNLFKRLGDSYYFNGELSQALPWYDSLYQSQKVLDAPYLFRYAMTLKNAENYTLGNQIMKEYEKVMGIKKQDTTYSKKDFLALIALQSDKFEVKNAFINSAYSDFSPAYYQSQLVFTSNRSDQKNPPIDQWTKKPYYDLYTVAIKRDNTFGTDITKFSEVINTIYHESSPVFTKDGNTIYFTKNNYNNSEYKSDVNGTNLLKIYRSAKDKNGVWQDPVELPFNSDEYACAHPALSPDEKYLFFSSNMPGTYGESDIFRVLLNRDGSMGNPINMGAKINTKQRESFPFLSNENIFYFSSDGHFGLGGYDIFMAEIDSDMSQIGEVVNMGKPINSPSDDFSLIIHTSDHTGFFASNRKEGSGDDDLYQFTQKQKPITNCKQQIKGFVTEDQTQKKVSNATVFLLNNDLEEVRSTQTDQEGMYTFEVGCNENYIVRVVVSGFYTQEALLPANKDFERENKLDFPLKVGEELGVKSIGYGDDMAHVLQLDPIYFDFNKSDIRPDAEIELQKITSLMKLYPNLKIEVRSHTDSRGDASYNLTLSNDRALSTTRYIVNQGIDKTRLIGKGFGATQLMNHCEKDVPCSDWEHEQNRRSEFIILNKELTKEHITKIKQEFDEMEVQIPEKQKENDPLNTNSTYDFNSDTIIYTVQIGAFSAKSSPNFPENIQVFHHQYPDQFVRYFSGVFSNRSEAEQHLQSLQKMDLGGFIVQLQGEKRQ